MRTNTWLGLIALNQAVQTLQNDQMTKREIARDAAFAKAHAAAQQGQFAMWIQTADGQRFERWSHHALEASRAIDDRQAAWDLAWELDLEERREAARAAALAEVEASTPSVPKEKTQRTQKLATIGCCGTAILGALGVGLIWYAEVFTESPRAYEIAFVAGLVAILLAMPATIVTVLIAWVNGAAERRERELPQLVDQHLDRTVVPRSFPWNANSDEEFLEERKNKIAWTVEKAAEKFPRGGKLVHLKGIYNTRPVQTDDKDAPESIQRLLVAFRDQDNERLAALERDRFA